MSIKNFLIAAFMLAVLSASSAAQAPPRTWRYYFKRGQLQYDAEMYDYAILSMNKALDLNPKLYRAANYIAEIYSIKGIKIQCLNYLEVSLKINPSQADEHNKIGEIYEFYEYRDKAFFHFSEAVRLDATHVMANCNLVRYYLRKKDKEKADFHFSQSLTYGRMKSDRFAGQAIEAEKNGETEKAMDLYMNILKINPADINIYMRLFELYRSRKEFRNAAEMLERLIFLKPDHEAAHIKLGHLYFADPLPGKKIRLLVKSINYFKTAISLNPANGDTYFSLSQVYRYMGKNDEADKIEKEMAEKTGGMK